MQIDTLGRAKWEHFTPEPSQRNCRVRRKFFVPSMASMSTVDSGSKWSGTPAIVLSLSQVPLGEHGLDGWLILGSVCGV